jgi:hypothetical protein
LFVLIYQKDEIWTHGKNGIVVQVHHRRERDTIEEKRAREMKSDKDIGLGKSKMLSGKIEH